MEASFDIALLVYEYKSKYTRLKQFEEKTDYPILSKEDSSVFTIMVTLYATLFSLYPDINIYFICNKFPLCLNREIIKRIKKPYSINDYLISLYPEILELLKQYSKKLKIKRKDKDNKIKEVELKINGKENSFFINTEYNIGVQFMFDYIIQYYIDKNENFLLPFKGEERKEIEGENDFLDEIDDKRKHFSNVLLSCCRRDSFGSEGSPRETHSESIHNEDGMINDFDMGLLMKNNMNKESKSEQRRKEAKKQCIII